MHSPKLTWHETTQIAPCNERHILGKKDGENPVYFFIHKWMPSYEHSLTHWTDWNDESEKILFENLDGESAP